MTESKEHEVGVAPYAAATSQIADSKIVDMEDRGLDVAARYTTLLADEGYSAKEERSLRWKVDFRLIPILWLNVCFGAMDKVSTSTAALYGMRQDTNLTGDRYSWVGSVFYVCTHPLDLLPVCLTRLAAFSSGTCFGVSRPRICFSDYPSPRLCVACRSYGESF